MVADVQVARLAGGPVLHRVAAAHDDGYVADALGEARVRRARPEPACREELAARPHVGSVTEPVFSPFQKIISSMNMAIRDPALAAEREAQHRGDRGGRLEAVLGVDEAVVGGGED